MKVADVDIYYNEGLLVVRRAGYSDVGVLAQRMSEDNIEELWVAHHMTPRAAVEIALKTSVMALTIEHEGIPCGIFGIRTDNLLGHKAEIYLLVTVDFENIGRIFLRHARRFIDMFLEFYPYLYNYAYCKNEKSIFWMKYCGATFEEPIEYGIEKKMFQLFHFQKG